MVVLNDSESCAQGSRCYEQLKAMDDMNNSWSWTYDSKYYDNSMLWMAWATPGRELRALDATNNLGLWLTSMTLGHEPRALDAMHNLVLGIIWMILDLDLKGQDVINNLRQLRMWTTPRHKLKSLNAMDNWGSWKI